MELKWILAIGLESAFWLMLAAFLVLRYRYRLDGITRVFVIGVVLDTAGILALGVWDFAETGKVSIYTAFIAGAGRLQPHRREGASAPARPLDGVQRAAEPARQRLAADQA